MGYFLNSSIRLDLANISYEDKRIILDECIRLVKHRYNDSDNTETIYTCIILADLAIALIQLKNPKSNKDWDEFNADQTMIIELVFPLYNKTTAKELKLIDHEHDSYFDWYTGKSPNRIKFLEHYRDVILPVEYGIKTK